MIPSPLLNLVPASLRAKLEGRTTLLKVAGNASWLSAEYVLRMAVGLFVSVWVARYLGPERFGVMNYALALTVIVFPLATLGLDQIVVRNIVEDSDQARDVLGTSLALRFVGGVMAFSLAIGIVSFLRPGDTEARLLVALASIGNLFRSFDVIDFWFRSQTQSKYVVWAKAVAFLIVTGLRITFILLEAPLPLFVRALASEFILSAAGMVVVYSIKQGSLRAWRVRLTWVGALLKDSWPLILSGFAVIIYMKIDLVMLRQMVGDQETGLYAAAARISELWYFIPIALSHSALPSIVEAKKKSEELYYQRLQKFFDIGALLSYAITIPVALLSGHIVALLLGEEYQRSGVILSIHIWAFVFVFMGSAQSSWNVTEGLLVLAFTRTFSGAIVNVLLNIILIPTYTGVGAAVATVVSQASAAIILNSTQRKTRRIFVMQIKSLFVFLRRR
jgi:PST family polysaccharide transporter